MADTEPYCGQCGKPFDDVPVEGGRAGAASAGGQPSGDATADGQPPGVASAHGQPSGDASADDQPSRDTSAGGQPSSDSRAGGGHPACMIRAALEPPRFCPQCARRMVVQVEPMGWRAVCSRHGERRG
jgi:hypothetical protein